MMGEIYYLTPEQHAFEQRLYDSAASVRPYVMSVLVHVPVVLFPKPTSREK